MKHSFAFFLYVVCLALASSLFAACASTPTAIPPTRAFVFESTAAPSEVPPKISTDVQVTPSVPAPTIPPTPKVRQRGGSIVVAGVGAVSHEITALPEFAADALYDSLLRVNPKDGSLIAGLAEKWQVSDDAKTFTFLLRDGVKWHDGKPLTADDVVFTLKTLSDPKIRITPVADFGNIADVVASDARTVKITLGEPYCAALTYIGRVKILPKHVLENKALDNITAQDLVGTGPLVLKSWKENALTFQANAAYWDGAPWITDWTYRAFDDENAARDAVRKNLANVLVTSNALTVGKDISYNANEFYALAINTKRAPFDNAQMRHALAAALDRSNLISAGDALLQTSVLPTFWASPSNLIVQNFDVTQARQLLNNAGWRDTDADGILDNAGKPLQVTLWVQTDDALAETTAQRIRTQLEQVGVHAVLKPTDHYLFLTRVFLQEFDLALVHFNIPLDPDQHYFWTPQEDKPGFGLNVTGYDNAQAEKILAAGNATPQCNPASRKQTYAPVFQQLASDLPMVFLFAPTRYVAANQVQGIAPNAFGGAFWNLNAWEFVP